MRNTYALILFLFLPILALSSLSDAGNGAVVAAQPSPHPNIRIRLSTSSNWSGYAVESSITSPTDDFVNGVSGSWIVPTLACSSSQNTYVAIWVGIDGYSDGTVEQTGTEQECVNGIQQNYAWVEMYPKPMQRISGITVTENDQIRASVTVSGGRFVISITDVTKGQTSLNTYKSNGKRQSAEWIVEAPYSGGVLPLANFGTVTFTSAQFTTSTGTYVINGLGQGSYDAITMIDPNGGTATPSGLSTSGDSFSVTYSSSSTTTTTTTGTGTTTTTSSSGLTALSVAVSADKETYTRNSWAYITVTVTTSTGPVGGASVTLTITNPGGGTSQGSGTTNSNGQVVFKYRITPNASTGKYAVFATASASGFTSGNGSTYFYVA